MTTSFKFKGKGIGSLDLLMNAIIDDMISNTDAIAVQSALIAAAIMWEDTPVRTGNAKSNWSIAREGQHPSYDPQAVGEGNFVDISGIRGRGDITIRNSAPHFNFIELGGSNQAPAGVMRLTMLRFDDFAKIATARVALG